MEANGKLVIDLSKMTKDQIYSLDLAEKNLKDTGLSFDVGEIKKLKIREWFFDWSLKGAIPVTAPTPSKARSESGPGHGPLNRRCGNCKYFKPKELSDYCYRYPPVIVMNGHTEQVRVERSDWCGEHKFKPE